MHFRTILSGTLALLLLSGPVLAKDSGDSLNPFKSAQGLSLPKLGLPKLFKSDNGEQVQLAQAGDPRITALEEQVRSLSGTIEELNFQILQMQEQLRKMQEDNEFRFQELEQKKTDAGSGGGGAVAASKPKAEATEPGVAPAASADAVPEPGTVEEIIIDDGSGNPGVTTTAVPPKTFGTITVDEKGNVTGGSVADDTTSNSIVQPSEAQSGGSIVAALPSTDDPEELYRNSYEFILSGDYGTAETGFRDHIARFPADTRTADARFWLGESLLGQKKYRDAAEVFLAANKEYPSAKKAPDMLLKLGVSLVGLDQRDVACATYSEIGKRYPDISSSLKERVKQEQALAKC